MVERVCAALGRACAPESDRGEDAAHELSYVAALVLAGGDGRRMGGEKPHRLLGVRRLLEAALEIARRHGGPAAIGVRRLEQARNADGADLVFDAPDIEGPLAGLVAGLAWAERVGARYLLTVPCDAPFLPHDLALRLHHRLARNVVLAALPRSASQLHPACALWRVEARETAPSYLKSGRASLRGFAEHVGFAVEDWGASTPDPFFNINTPSDLERAELLIAQSHFE